MRVFSIVIIGFGLIACGGVTGGGLDDGGNGDAAEEKPQPIDCNGKSCSAYCIHPSTTTCPSCTLAPDSGTCPAGSTLETYCPAGPPMQGDAFCVTYPSPDPPYCSDTIPASCFPANTPTKPDDHLHAERLRVLSEAR